MEKFVYHAPTEIVFGKDTELRTAELVKKYGGSRVFVVYGGQSAVKSGLLDRVMQNLKENDVAAEAMGGVVPNPLVSTAREMVKAALAFQADFILAVGGGSVIDTAKGVAHAVADPSHDIWDFWTGTKVTKSLPIGTILTISAAGSETSNSAVLTNDTKVPPTKRGITTEFNRCRFAIMNPELTMTLPKYQIGAGAADIFMHTSERYFAAVLGNHLTDEIAEGLFRDIVLYGPKGVEDPQDYEAMSEIMWCGSVSHVGLTGVGAQGDTPREGDWACHQLEHELSGMFDVTHGAGLAAIWEAWSTYVMGLPSAGHGHLRPLRLHPRRHLVRGLGRLVPLRPQREHWPFRAIRPQGLRHYGAGRYEGFRGRYLEDQCFLQESGHAVVADGTAGPYAGR